MSALPANIERFGPEHRALADSKLRRAIEFHAEAYQLDEDEDLLASWAVVSHWLCDDTEHVYSLQMDGMTMPTHELRGLMSLGVELAVEGTTSTHREE